MERMCAALGSPLGQLDSSNASVSLCDRQNTVGSHSTKIDP